MVRRLGPSAVVVDPITSIVSVSGIYGVKSMLTRLVDFLKVQQITAMFTNLTFGGNLEGRSEEGISSLMDTWIMLSDVERNGLRVRGLNVVKSRGMAHSRELRELVVSDKGVELGDVMAGNGLGTTAGH
jgi:circadian clock protein KaiC